MSGVFVRSIDKTIEVEGISRAIVCVEIEEGPAAGTTVQIPFFRMRRAED